MGKSRWDCSEFFLQQLARFKYIPWNEIPIEGKHARVTKTAVHKHIGPTKVSMSNRMELFRLHMHRYGRAFTTDFLARFDQARSCHKLPSLLNLEAAKKMIRWMMR